MIATDQDIEIIIDRRKVCRYLGYTPDVDPSSRIASLLDEYIETAQNLIQPAYSCVIREIRRVEKKQVHISRSVVFESDVISRLAEKCDHMAVFVLTIGPRLEDMAGQLAEDNKIVESYVLDAIGTVAAENLADFVQGMTGEYAHLKKLSISRRFSPGYCDWNIDQQEAVFRALNGKTSSVELSSGCLMTPQKSVSGIIGIGTRDSGVTEYNPCRTCQKRSCVGRR